MLSVEEIPAKRNHISANVVLLSLIFFTSSFDIFLNLKIGGFSFRLSYLLVGLLVGINLLSGKLMVRFLGLHFFLLWTLFLLLFVSNTTLLSRNIGYMLWHIVHFMFLFFLPQAIKTKESFLKLFKVYIWSFALLATIGIFQFLLGVVGVDFFIEQWWPSGLPRVNGFSYEPSYYATYMIIGWALCFSLLINEVHVLSKRKMKLIFALITIGIFLSTSRMGILFMVILSALYFINILFKTIRSLRISKLRFYYITIVGMLGLVAVFVVAPLILIKYDYFLSGTGVQGQSAHSAIRFSIMGDLWNVFLTNPLVGYSLGGVPSAIGEYRGVIVSTIDQAKELEGINVFLEVLVASGIIGFVFFILYLINLLVSGNKLKNQYADIDKLSQGILQALISSLVVELLILCFNQNILRLYLWVHIAMLNVAYFTFKREILKVNLQGNEKE